MAAHINLFNKAVDFCKNNELDFEVSNAATGSKYIRVYIQDTTTDWNGEFRARFSDHAANQNDLSNSFDSFIQGNNWNDISDKLERCVALNGTLNPDDPFLTIE